MCNGTQLLRMNLCYLQVDKYFRLVLEGTIWEEGSEQWEDRWEQEQAMGKGIQTACVSLNPVSAYIVLGEWWFSWYSPVIHLAESLLWLQLPHFNVIDIKIYVNKKYHKQTQASSEIARFSYIHTEYTYKENRSTVELGKVGIEWVSIIIDDSNLQAIRRIRVG